MIQPFELTVSDEAFQYLKLQRGAISDLSNDRKAWETAYRRSLLGDFATMQKWLPERCGAILDVGSGLGGINILLARHYKIVAFDMGTEPILVSHPRIHLLDGERDRPTVYAHDQTFNDMDVAFAFLEENGIRLWAYIHPNWEVPTGEFDLVVSTQAWCFHFPPRQYLSRVKKAAKPGATLILDVRKDKTDWREELRDAFTEVGIAVSAHKFDRVVFRNGK